jgi:hypothetical protein
VPLRSGNVRNAADLPVLSDHVQFPVIRLHGVQLSTQGHHAVPGPVWLEVAWVRMSDGVRLLECTEIRHKGPRSVWVHADDPLRLNRRGSPSRSGFYSADHWEIGRDAKMTRSPVAEIAHEGTELTARLGQRIMFPRAGAAHDAVGRKPSSAAPSYKIVRTS